MTIAQRNILLKTGIIITALLTITSIVLTIFLINKFYLQSLADIGTQIQPEFLSALPLFRPMEIIILFQSIFFPLVALITLGMILFLFEKTQTIEVAYFSVFIFIISIEALRLFVPALKLWERPVIFTVLLSKTVFFCRIYAISAILISALFAAYPFTRHSKSVLFAISVFAFSVTFAIPANTSTLMTNFLIQSGFSNIDKIIFAVFALIASLTYYIRGKQSNIKEYITAAWSTFLILFGYMLLLTTASILPLITGIVAFITGTYYYLSAIHKYHLWQ